MALRLYIELLNAYNKKGYAMKKKNGFTQSMSSKFFSLWRDPHGDRTSSLSRTRRRGGGQAEGRVHHAKKDFKRAS